MAMSMDSMQASIEETTVAEPTFDYEPDREVDLDELMDLLENQVPVEAEPTAA